MKITDIKLGDWISDTAGVYEVTEIADDKVYTKEVVFSEDENSDDYTLGSVCIKTKSDLNRCSKM